MNGQKIINFIKKLDDESEKYVILALITFFVEALFPEEYDLNKDEVSLEEIYSKVPESFRESLYICAMEFFFSNEYQKETTAEVWNIVDLFIKKKGVLLTPLEKDYYKGLRDSYMGLYEIIHIDPDKSLTLKSMIQQDPYEIVVKEKLATRQLVKGDTLGGRVVHTKNGAVLAGGMLLLSQDAAHKAKQSIEEISEIMLNKKFLQMAEQEQSNPALMVRKMWVKEIAGSWFRDHLKLTKEPIFFNRDGDDLEYVTLTFPLKIAPKEARKILNGLSELIPWETSWWIWPATVKKRKSHSHHDKNPLFLETQIMKDQEGKAYPIYAEIKIKGKNLIVDVNSQKRASILKNFLEIHLNEGLEKPLVKTYSPAALSASAPSAPRANKETENFLISPEKKRAFVHAFMDQHYHEWIDSTIPALGGKTPRETVQTEQGRKKLMDMLKDMEKLEERRAKTNKEGYSPYNFDWLWQELGLK